MRHAAGRDLQSRVMGDTASNGTGSYAPANYMALSESTAAPVDADTTLAGELTAAGGGLIRKQSVYAHTTGASNYTLTAVFTCNASDGLPKTAAKMAVFNAASAGSMFVSNLIGSAPILAVVGDQTTVTETVSI